MVSGTGNSSGTNFNDAFYVFYPPDYTPYSDSAYYQLNIGWVGNRLVPFLGGIDNIRNFIIFIEGVGQVSPPAVPAFSDSCSYDFVVNVPANAGQLAFGVADGTYSDNGGQYNISVFQLEFGSIPVITTQPVNQIVNQGSNAVFTVVATGMVPLTYQWQFNGANLEDTWDGHIAGSTLPSLTITDVSTNDAGSYSVLVSNEAVSTNSDKATLTVLIPPEIAIQPISRFVIQGSNAVFTVVATGTKPLGYQWQFNGANLGATGAGHISGAGSDTLTIVGVTTNDAGDYSVMVTNSAGNANSDIVTLQVAGMKSMVPSSEYDALVDFFNVTAGAAWVDNSGWLDPNSSQWYGIEVANLRFDVNGNFILHSGNVSAISMGDGEGNGLEGALPITVEWLTALHTIDLSGNHLTGSIPLGWSGFQSLRYLDLSDNNFTGVIPFDLAVLPLLQYFDLSHNSFSGSIPSLGGLFQVTNLDLSHNRLGGTLTNLLSFPAQVQRIDLSGNLISNAIPLGFVSPSFTTLQYLDLSHNRLSGAIPNSFPEFTHLQYLNLGANSLTGSLACVMVPYLLALQDLDLSANGFSGSIPSLGFFVNLTNLDLSGNALTGSVPRDVADCANLIALNLSANHLTNYICEFPKASVLESLEIQFNDLDFTSNSAPYGVNNNFYVQYMLSNNIDVTYLPQNAPSIIANPQDESVPGGGPNSFSVSVLGATPLSYQWQFNGTNLADNGRISGSTTATLSINPVQSSDQGSYQIIITNDYDSITSDVAVLTVPTTNSAPQIIGQPVSLSVSAGSNVVFGVKATGTTPLSYQWSFDGTKLTDGAGISGSQSASLSIANALSGNAGSYSVLVSNAQGSNSAAATLTVSKGSPAVTWTPPQIDYGFPLNSNVLDATANIAGTFLYAPAAGTVLDSGTSAASVIFTPADTVDFNSVTNGVNIIVSPAPLLLIGSNAMRLYGQKNPVFTGAILGLANSDNITAAYTCSAVTNSPPGTYPIVTSLIDPNNRLTNYSVTIDNGALTVTPPFSLASVTPAGGPTNGGTVVTILGTGFEVPATVAFGGKAALSVTVNSATNITAVAPSAPHLGPVNVTLTNADGQTAVLPNGFVYGWPRILSLQANQTVLAGSNVSFSVAASGPGPFSYQWQFNGTNLPKTNIISTVAGNGTYGYSGDGAAATNAELTEVTGVAVDASGNLFIMDCANCRIRKVGTNGMITTVVGNGTYGYSGDGGAATNAKLTATGGLAVDASGSLFFADLGNQRIRKVGSNGMITTVAGNGTYGYSGDGGAATNAELYYPAAVAADASGNLFIADYGNNRVRKVGTNGMITTVAGNGTGGYSGDRGAATNAELYLPTGVAVDASGNLFIADYGNNRVRKVGTNGMITAVAGNGTGGYSGDRGAATNSELKGPWGVAVDASGNLFIADGGNNRVREVGTNGMITTVAGNGSGGYSGDGGAATNAELNGAGGVAVDASGNLFIADYSNLRTRRVDLLGATLVLNDVGAANAGAYSVVVSSPYGSVTSATTTLGVLGLPVSFVTSSGAIHYSNGQLHLSLSGLTGQGSVLVEASTNLTQWSPVFTNPPGFGTIQFIDPIASNYLQRYYRAVVLP